MSPETPNLASPTAGPQTGPADGGPEGTSPPGGGQKPPQGFHMGARRTIIEIAVVVAVVGGGIAFVLWVAGRAAAAMTDSVPLSVDETIGEQSSRVMNATHGLCANSETNAYVKNIVATLTATLGDKRFSFKVVVADTPEVNAFALPGGYVTVNRGLLEAADTGEEIAAVLAHEITHVTHRHGTERMLRELGATSVLSLVFGGTAVAVPAKLTHDFVSNAYDRDQEREADTVGLSLLVEAGLDPRGMASFFARLAKDQVTPPAWLSTHPDPGDRATTAEQASHGVIARVHLPSPKGLRCQ